MWGVRRTRSLPAMSCVLSRVRCVCIGDDQSGTVGRRYRGGQFIWSGWRKWPLFVKIV